MNTASDKQVAFIKRLLAEREGNEAAESFRLQANALYREGRMGKQQASSIIDNLLKIRKAAAPQEELEDGFYEVSGKIVKVIHAVHGSGNQYAKRLNENSGKFEYVQGLVTAVRKDGKRLTLERAKELGKLYGRCTICGRTLTNETSIAQGIGPVCAGRL